MPREPLDPQECLRSLCAEALLRAHPDRPLFPVSLGLQAVANAFVMLGLLPEALAEQILAEHRLGLEAKGFGNVWGVAKGELTVRPGAHEYWQARVAGPAGPGEVPMSVAGAGVSVLPPAQVPVGPAEPPWPTPAECYLAALAPATRISINESEAGPEDTAEIIATVADSLMAVGALPVTSALLREPAGGGAGWRTPLQSRWGRRAHQRDVAFRASEHRDLAARLPLEHAAAVIESVSAQDELVSIDLYGHPWVMGEYWPMITPCFQVHATDAAGLQYKGVPGNWHGLPGRAGRGSFWLWPPVSADRTSLRVIISTLWEAAWAEVDLPR